MRQPNDNETCEEYLESILNSDGELASTKFGPNGYFAIADLALAKYIDSKFKKE